jgi:hypothetical protein
MMFAAFIDLKLDQPFILKALVQIPRKELF